MNKAKIILNNLRTKGVQISVVGNTLRLEADQGTISNDMRENIKEYKSGIITLLKQKHSCEKSEESEERGVQTSKEGLISLNSLSSQEKIKNVMAQGYGCDCGHNLYEQIEDFVEATQPEDTKWEHKYQLGKVWQCENCKTIYEIIGGTKGPVFIN
jgi:hypothetical protein